MRCDACNQDLLAIGQGEPLHVLPLASPEFRENDDGVSFGCQGQDTIEIPPVIIGDNRSRGHGSDGFQWR